MNVEPLVSIIIPTYNRVDLLQDTLKSILNQTYDNFEVIIISDASPDNTAKVIRSYKDIRIKFYELKRNLKYPSRVRNVGLKEAKGEFIAFCDDDDLWVKEKLEIQISYLLSNENFDMIATNSILFPGHLLPSMQLWRNKVLTYKELLSGNSIITPSVILRKTVLDTIGFFDENEILHIGEDWDLWIRVLQNKEKSILLLKECLVFNRLGNEKITDTYSDPIRSIKFKEYIYVKHRPYSNENLKKLLDRKDISTDLFKNNILTSTLRSLYSKKTNLNDVMKSNNLSLYDKFVVIIKFYTKYIYKAITQRKYHV